MKRTVALLIAVISIIILIGCAPQSKRLIGTWEFMGYRNERVKSVFKTDSTVVFQEDGTGYAYEIMDDGTTVPVLFTYAIEDEGTVKLMLEDRKATVAYSIESLSDTLVLDGLIYRRPAVEAPTPEPTPSPTPGPTPLPATFRFGDEAILTGETEVAIRGSEDHIIFITPEEVEALINLCPNLSYLHLSYCCMEDYSKLGELTDLRYLTIDHTVSEQDPDEDKKKMALTDLGWIGDLTNLIWLDVPNNQIKDIQEVTKLTNLRAVDFSNNELDNRQLDYLKDLTKLLDINLSFNQWITDVTALTEVKGLKYISLEGNLNLKSVEPLKNLRELKDLNISGCPIESYRPFKDFAKLETLWICGCEYKDSLLNLKDCKTLQTIYISKEDTKIREELEKLTEEHGLDLKIEQANGY